VFGGAFSCCGGGDDLSGCQNSRVTNLEQRLNQLENKTRELESERTKSADEDAGIRAKLEACVEGRKHRLPTQLGEHGTNNGMVRTMFPEPTLAEMQRQKQVEIETRRLLYSK
jgi:hypothetical protein